MILCPGLTMGYIPLCAQHYTVRQGDTCNKISQEQQVSTYVITLDPYYAVLSDGLNHDLCRYQLFSSNLGTINAACSNLFPGEVSLIPYFFLCLCTITAQSHLNLFLVQLICLGFVGQLCGPVYTVVQGDTCQKVADKFHISVQVLRAHNPNVDAKCDNLDVGEVKKLFRHQVYANSYCRVWMLGPLCRSGFQLGISIWCLWQVQSRCQWLRSCLKIGGPKVDVVSAQSLKFYCNFVASDNLNMTFFRSTPMLPGKYLKSWLHWAI